MKLLEEWAYCSFSVLSTFRCPQIELGSPYSLRARQTLAALSLCRPTWVRKVDVLRNFVLGFEELVAAVNNLEPKHKPILSTFT